MAPQLELLLTNVNRHVILDQLEIDYFLSLLKSRKLNKGDYLLKALEPCTTLNYVSSGVLKAFYSDDNEKESTIMFAIADWWITDMPCFVNQSAANISIEAIAKSNVLQITKTDLDQLYIQVPKFERYFRILMQNAYVREQLRMLENLSLPAEIRYTNFLKKYPSIAKQVTQKNMASYLGITPEFLSVIRSKAAKGAIS